MANKVFNRAAEAIAASAALAYCVWLIETARGDLIGVAYIIANAVKVWMECQCG